MEKQNKPIIVNVEAGAHYFCTCGKSKAFPYCDGEHVNTESVPHVEIITEAKKIAICACGKSNSVFCNGAHSKS